MHWMQKTLLKTARFFYCSSRRDYSKFPNILYDLNFGCPSEERQEHGANLSDL
jgi:hypothetical protein